MDHPDYEYRGLMAEAWDVLRGDTSQWEDRFYYLEVVRRYGQPVLDVGCGTGRLLLDFLQQGIDIDGVDNSPDMLHLCRQKAARLGLEPRLYEQYLESLDLPRRYETILIPSSSLQLIIEPGMALQALERAREHLLPGGRLVASIMTLWVEGDEVESSWERRAVRESDGAEFRRQAWSRFDPETEIEATRDIYQKIVGGEVVAEEVHVRASATRSYTQSQARNLMEGAGFRDIVLTHEFTFDPAEPEDVLFVITGAR